MKRVAVLCALAACGREGFEQPDAPPPIDPCVAETEPLPAFTFRLLDELSDMAKSDDDPVMAADGLEIFFTSNRRGGTGMDVFRSTRAAIGDRWDPPVYVEELSSPVLENTLELSSDALTMWLVSEREEPGNEDLYEARRPSRDAPWQTPQKLAPLSNPALDRGPSVFDEDRAMIFHSGRSGAGPNLNWWLSIRIDREAAWQIPVPFAAANDGMGGSRGWISPCGLELYYQAVRTGTQTDFFVRSRPSTGERFGAEQKVLGLDSELYDQDLRLSPDRRRAVFSSTRFGTDDIYEASR